MKNADEERLLADLYTQLGGSKTKRDDWITIAKKCEQLSKEYGSPKKVAEKLQRSYQLIRSILSLLRLPEEVQQLIKNRKIGYDAAQRLSTMRTPAKQIEVARTIAELPSHKAREIIYYAKVNPHRGLGNYRERITAPKKKPEKIYVTVIPLTKDTYKKLNDAGKKKGISLEKLILSIVGDWMERRGG